MVNEGERESFWSLLDDAGEAVKGVPGLGTVDVHIKVTRALPEGEAIGSFHVVLGGDRWVIKVERATFGEAVEVVRRLLGFKPS